MSFFNFINIIFWWGFKLNMRKSFLLESVLLGYQSKSICVHIIAHYWSSLMRHSQYILLLSLTTKKTLHSTKYFSLQMRGTIDNTRECFIKSEPGELFQFWVHLFSDQFAPGRTQSHISHPLSILCGQMASQW